jgi:hypothetical protein
MTSAITPTNRPSEFQPKREVLSDPSDESQIRIVVTNRKARGLVLQKHSRVRKIEKNVRQPLRKPGVLDVETQQGDAGHHSRQSDPLYGLS